MSHKARLFIEERLFDRDDRRASLCRKAKIAGISLTDLYRTARDMGVQRKNIEGHVHWHLSGDIIQQARDTRRKRCEYYHKLIFKMDEDIQHVTSHWHKRSIKKARAAIVALLEEERKEAV